MIINTSKLGEERILAIFDSQAISGRNLETLYNSHASPGDYSRSLGGFGNFPETSKIQRKYMVENKHRYKQ